MKTGNHPFFIEFKAMDSRGIMSKFQFMFEKKYASVNVIFQRNKLQVVRFLCCSVYEDGEVDYPQANEMCGHIGIGILLSVSPSFCP